jgi:hypothetical protein
VIYTGLAILIGLGLIGFGIGGGFGGGGLLSAASNNEASGTSSRAAQIKRYRKLTQQQPTNQAAWEGLTRALLQESGNFTQNGVSAKGKELFQEAAQAWQSYMALNPAKPNTTLAQEMVAVYSEEGLNQPAQAVSVLQIVTAARPTSAALWAALSEYAYKAHNTRIGDLAAAKAVALAPAVQRTRVKNELAELRKTGGERVFTTTTNGKTFAVKKSPSGSFTGTEVKTTPQPAGSSTATTSSTAKK